MSKYPVIQFEMPYDDAARVAQFYKDTFGWDMQTMPGSPAGDYVTAQTAAPGQAGAINGGFFKRKHDFPAQVPSVTVAVDDIEDAMQKVKAAGGEVLGEPMDIPQVGRYVSFTDSEGNRVVLLQQKS